MFSSTIITTIGRTKLSRAVESLLCQTLPADNFEIIVVNDSGAPLPPQDWQDNARVRIINTNRRERSVARNTGAANARGRYLHFLDDDDWLLPHALKEFWELAMTQEAAWLYGGARLVDRKGRFLHNIQHNLQGNCFLQTMVGEWIPLQSSLIEAGIFHDLGGFNPLLTGPEDIDLLRRTTLVGDILEVPGIVACIERGEEDSTTNYTTHPSISRRAREDILDLPGTYARMIPGANTSFWNGKLVRIYLTSAVWNLQHQRLFTAYSRLFHSFRSLAHGGRHIFTADFWRALTRPYKSLTFERGIREAEAALQN
jgi:glycosyltransferase involved in cell wall biosynthesis